jgi:hypothetical protein
MTAKRRPASRGRYAATHPALTVHFDLETHAAVVELRERTGLTLNQLVRQALGSLEGHVNMILARGRAQGIAEGRKAGHAAGWQSGYTSGYEAGSEDAEAAFRLTYPCRVCAERIEIRVDGAEARFAAAALTERGWRHTACINQPSPI